MHYTPVVLRPISLLALLEYVLSRHVEPSTIVVCSSQEVFLRNLLQSMENEPETDDSYDLLTPTLQLIKTSRSVGTVFCPSLQILHAWLCSHSTQFASISHQKSNVPVTLQNGETVSNIPMLVVVNPIALHRDTSAFSAQGLSRAFAAMIETAFRTHKKLFIAECSIPNITRDLQTGTTVTNDRDEEEEMAEYLPHQAERAHIDPWNEDVSILNVTTKSFGAGERGWAGRTIKTGQVAGRWCRFETPNEKAPQR